MLPMNQMSGSKNWEKPFMAGGLPRTNQRVRNASILDNNVMIMPIVKNIGHFRRWIPSYPFYRNVDQEGVRLYGAA